MPTVEYRTKSGCRVPGVTTVISGNLAWNKQALMYWAWNEGREGRDFRKTRDAAAGAGTIAHAMVEADLKGRPYSPPEGTPKEIIDKAENAFLAYLEFKDVVGLKMIESERSMVSEIYKFGGTIDIAAVKKVTAIIDLKTSNDIYADHKIQIAAYGRLWNENVPENPIKAYYILKLGKDDGSFAYHYFPPESLDNEWKAFEALLVLHNLKKLIGG